MTKRGARRREVRRRVIRSSELIPLPRHPYRDSAIFYGFLALALLGIVYVTGGDMTRALIYAAGFFVIATAFSWWRFRAKLAERARQESAMEGRG
jgi:hypothetical protein